MANENREPPALTAEEREIIDWFRWLPEDDRNHLLGWARKRVKPKRMVEGARQSVLR